ncbi:MAG: response regulator [Lachnospiraceae bacterium]|nr:response regulator [Lachnospiraceae bacterium]
MRLNYEYLYLTVLTVVEVALLICIFVAFLKKGDLAVSMRKVGVATIFALLFNALYIVAPNEFQAMTWMCMFSLSIDWVLLMFLDYTRSYTDTRFLNPSVIALFYFLAILDSISLVLNVPFRHVLDVKEIYNRHLHMNIFVTEHQSVFYLLHLVFCYFICVLILLWLIRKMASTASFYRRKYELILISFVVLLVVDGVAVFFHTPFNLSVIFYGIIATIITYFSLSYIPRTLMSSVLELVVRELDNAVVCFDYEGKMVFANQAAERLAIETNRADFLSELYREWKDRFGSNSEIINNWDEELHFGDEVRYYSFQSKKLLDDNHQNIGIYITTYDRTSEVLRHRNEMEQAENKMKSESSFWANISHEMRTPANAILGMNEVLLRNVTDPEIKQYADCIKVSTETLLSLINDVLDFSRINARSMSVVPSEYQVLHLLKGLYVNAYQRAKKKGLELKIEVDSFIPERLLGDELRIQQVILNLITNAIKYTNEGSVTLRLYGERRYEEFYLHVEVEDTGIGLREESIPLLFTAFERIDEAKVHGIQGTGLGINICEQLLRQMDSHLEVQSKYGKGSRFSFRIRQPQMSESYVSDVQEYLEREVGKFEDRSEQTADNKTPFRGGRTLNILYVDDNEINCEVFKALTKEAQVVTTYALRGLAALEETRKQKFDLIFMDHLMPEMNGDEVFLTLRGEEGNPNQKTPVIMLTANVGDEFKNKFLDMGFEDYMTKPIQPEILAKTFAKWM